MQGEGTGCWKWARALARLLPLCCSGQHTWWPLSVTVIYRRCWPILSTRGADRFFLVEKDALDLEAADVAKAVEALGNRALPSKLISNLPYAVAATVVLDYFQRFSSLQSATVMVQREVADRMAASPGSKTYGAYTVKLGLFAQPAGRFAVGPGNFYPPPRVDSAVIRLDRIVVQGPDGAPASPQLLRAACTMADAAFANRRKTLANSCKAYFASIPEVQLLLPTIFDCAAIDPRLRGEALTQQQFLALGQALLELMPSNVNL